ncbi:hypothetical protein ACPESR_13710 [Nocardia testacea]|uniref:hypothetical protein n=1 Tax=Nocardia testacea TaxID=248551 RepID=UPI003C30E66E
MRRDLCEANWREMAAGRSAAQRHPVAVAEADRAFELLAEGFARTLRSHRPAGH